MCIHVRWCLSSVLTFCHSWNAKLGAAKTDAESLCRVKLRGITYSLPGLHILKEPVLYKLSLQAHHTKGWGVMEGSVFPWFDFIWFLSVCSPDSSVCPCQVGVFVPHLLPCALSALPVLACCVSPHFWLVKFGGQREVGFFLLDFIVVVCVFLAAFFFSYYYQASWLLLWGKRVLLAIPRL